MNIAKKPTNVDLGFYRGNFEIIADTNEEWE